MQDFLEHFYMHLLKCTVTKALCLTAIVIDSLFIKKHSLSALRPRVQSIPHRPQQKHFQCPEDSADYVSLCKAFPLTTVTAIITFTTTFISPVLSKIDHLGTVQESWCLVLPGPNTLVSLSLERSTLANWAANCEAKT